MSKRQPVTVMYPQKWIRALPMNLQEIWAERSDFTFFPESHQHHKDQEFLEDLNSGERLKVQAVGGVGIQQSRFLFRPRKLKWEIKEN